MNNCSFAVKAVLQTDYGNGLVVVIKPNESKDVPGFIMNDVAGERSGEVFLSGSISCQEKVIGKSSFVSMGKQSVFGNKKAKLVICHHKEEPKLLF